MSTYPAYRSMGLFGVGGGRSRGGANNNRGRPQSSSTSSEDGWGDSDGAPAPAPPSSRPSTFASLYSSLPSRSSAQTTSRYFPRGDGGRGQQFQGHHFRPTPTSRTSLQQCGGTPVVVVNDKPMEKAVELASLLECPVCYSIPNEEVYNCQRGHSVCSDCSKRLSRCALCASPSTGSRNFMIESLIAYFHKFSIALEGNPSNIPLLVDCVYKSEGCKVATLKSKIDLHSRKCDFRRVRCVALATNQNQSIASTQATCGTNEMLKLSEYLNHLKLAHKIIGQSDPSGHFKKIDRLFRGTEITTSWPPYYLEYDGKVFLRHASIMNRNIYWWIQLIGPDRDAYKYQATISLQSPHKVLKVSWTIPVHPIRCTVHTIVKTKEFASITTAKLLHFCDFNEQFQDRIATHTWPFEVKLSKVA